MAKLTSKKRNSLKSSQFAEPGKRKYPISDPSHARNALARVSQHGTAAEKASVRKKVHAKYPSIGESGRAGKYTHGKRKTTRKRVSGKA